MEYFEDDWVLLTGTKFSAHWIASRFDQELRRAAGAVGIAGKPSVRAR